MNGDKFGELLDSRTAKGKTGTEGGEADERVNNINDNGQTTPSKDAAARTKVVELHYATRGLRSYRLLTRTPVVFLCVFPGSIEGSRWWS